MAVLSVSEAKRGDCNASGLHGSGPCTSAVASMAAWPNRLFMCLTGSLLVQGGLCNFFNLLFMSSTRYLFVQVGLCNQYLLYVSAHTRDKLLAMQLRDYSCAYTSTCECVPCRPRSARSWRRS